MRKVIKRIANVCMIACLLVTISTTTVFATMVAYGSEKAGYMVSTEQLRKNTNTFDDSKLDNKYKSYMNYGAKVWKDCNVLTLKRKKSSVNKVITYRSKDTSVLANTRWTADQYGRIKTFVIKFNTVAMDKKTTSINKSVAAHEIGHTIGLLDLYEKRNQGKLMYGIIDKEYKKPTSKDIKGAKYATRK